MALLGGARCAAELADALHRPVVATSAENHLEVARRLLDEVDLVVGLAQTPAPTASGLHQETSELVGAYTGVVSWHGLPALHQRLAEVVAPGAAAGAHVLFTASDPAPGRSLDASGDLTQEDLTFLREIAAAVTAVAELPAASIAWQGGTRRPTSLEALRTLVEVHGVRQVVVCPVAPADTGEPALRGLAEELGVQVVTADLGHGVLVDLLATVVTTAIDGLAWR